MNHQELMKKALETTPWFRERKEKNMGIAKLILKKFYPGLEIDPKQIEDIIVLGSSLDRAWRKMLQENPELRGTDYDDKEMLEQDKQLELGYMPGHDADVKKKNKFGDSTTTE